MHFKAKFIHRKHRWSIIWFYLKMAKRSQKTLPAKQALGRSTTSTCWSSPESQQTQQVATGHSAPASRQRTKCAEQLGGAPRTGDPLSRKGWVLILRNGLHWHWDISVGPRRPGTLAPEPGNDAVQPYGPRKIGILTFLGLSFSIHKIVVVIGIVIHSSQGCWTYIVFIEHSIPDTYGVLNECWWPALFPQSLTCYKKKNSYLVPILGPPKILTQILIGQPTLLPEVQPSQFP